MEYTSKDIEYMMRLKQAVYHGIQQYSPEQQHDIWETVRKQVTMEDLRIYASNTLNRPVLFPAMSCHRKVAVVFDRPPMDNELDNLHKMMARLNIHEDHVYITHFQKVATNDSDELLLLEKLLHSELNIVKPGYIITYGVPIGEEPHRILDYQGSRLVNSLSMSFQAEEEEAMQQKRIIWEDTKRLFQQAPEAVR